MNEYGFPIVKTWFFFPLPADYWKISTELLGFAPLRVWLKVIRSSPVLSRAFRMISCECLLNCRCTKSSIHIYILYIYYHIIYIYIYRCTSIIYNISIIADMKYIYTHVYTYIHWYIFIYYIYIYWIVFWTTFLVIIHLFIRRILGVKDSNSRDFFH